MLDFICLGFIVLRGIGRKRLNKGYLGVDDLFSVSLLSYESDTCTLKWLEKYKYMW